MITLSDGTTTLELPGDFDWPDEYTWQSVVQDAGYTLTGALVVETATKQAGRPITLVGADDRAWVTRADLEQLRTWADIPGQELTLTLRGTSYTVLFRHQDTAIDAVEQILFVEDPAAGTYYSLTLRFMEI
ncbi:hypothetical protein [Sedimenticola hydrogenitrophicus]|uniref:hypothetical protein n=1 Tax=Sedimenticola hydrogenitrophicus TaxID=2967975 RepID=UPI0023B16BCE|nr:hypothetical protein [Sedimenticola hydrogenitrophicus]